jgi:hypothetical protein
MCRTEQRVREREVALVTGSEAYPVEVPRRKGSQKRSNRDEDPVDKLGLRVHLVARIRVREEKHSAPEPNMKEEFWGDSAVSKKSEILSANERGEKTNRVARKNCKSETVSIEAKKAFEYGKGNGHSL